MLSHKYLYNFDKHGDNVPAYVLKQVGDSKKILEIGAGPGSITRVLFQQGHKVTAVEIDPEAIKLLTPFCERVVNCDLNDNSWVDQNFCKEKFDVVLITDVLEHLVNPWSTLKNIETLIDKDGFILASVPNASHLGVLASLLTQDFDYKETGLLDKTHIRFFCLDNIQKLFKSADLKITNGSFIYQDPSETNLKSSWEKLSLIERFVLSRRKEGFVFQVLVKAVKKNNDEQEISLKDIPLSTSFRVFKLKHVFKKIVPKSLHPFASKVLVYIKKNRTL